MVLKPIPVRKARKEPTGAEDSIGDSYFDSYVNEEVEGRRRSSPPAPPRKSSVMVSRFDVAKHAGGNSRVMPMVTAVRRSMQPMAPI